MGVRLRVLLAAVALACAWAPGDAGAQFWDRLKERARQKVDERLQRQTDSAIDRGLDKAEDAATAAARGGPEPAAAGGGAGRPGQAAAAGPECPILRSADVKAVTGVEVRAVPRDPMKGFGAGCGNYVTAAGKAYLGVTRLESKGQYAAAVETVPADLYPHKQSLPGLGDEAVLFEDASKTIQYLVARKGSRGVVLFSFAGAKLSDGHLRELAARAVAAK